MENKHSLLIPDDYKIEVSFETENRLLIYRNEQLSHLKEKDFYAISSEQRLSLLSKNITFFIIICKIAMISLKKLKLAYSFS